jgi:hypothetical protein
VSVLVTISRGVDRWEAQRARHPAGIIITTGQLEQLITELGADRRAIMAALGTGQLRLWGLPCTVVA